MKYVMIRVTLGGDNSRDIPFMFPDICTHAVVAAYMTDMLKRDHPGATIRPVSAGFVSSTDCAVECYGESETLKMSSRKEDSQIICMHDYLYGIV